MGFVDAHAGPVHHESAALLDPLMPTWLVGSVGMPWVIVRFLMDDVDLEIESSSAGPEVPEPPSPALGLEGPPGDRPHGRSTPKNRTPARPVGAERAIRLQWRRRESNPRPRIGPSARLRA